jgi:hypothetical protein
MLKLGTQKNGSPTRSSGRRVSFDKMSTMGAGFSLSSMVDLAGMKDLDWGAFPE